MDTIQSRKASETQNIGVNMIINEHRAAKAFSHSFVIFVESRSGTTLLGLR